jgi:hypothetical protein
MGVVHEMCKKTTLPKMVKIRQRFSRPRIEVEDIPKIIQTTLAEPKFASTLRPGMRIAITAGSRGISNIALITKAIVDFVKSRSATPFVVPAMGSHGGATAEGQVEVLRGYEITEEYLGCRILSSMETVQIGHTREGHKVVIDKNAAEADGIIVSCRIKPHTAFRGPYESGVMKMLAIGLGKQEGAEIIHESGFDEFARLLPLFGNVILQKTGVLFALGAIENPYDETCKIAALTAAEVPDGEPPLLQVAKSLMPRILFDRTDVLVVDRIGKNYSGFCMDPNITGRFGNPYARGGIDAQRVVALDLTDESHGNAEGVGVADIITRRLFNKVDLEMTYPNCITATTLKGGCIPIIAENDQDALRLAVQCCNKINKLNPRLIRLTNTLNIEYIWISEAFLEEAAVHPMIEIVGKPESLSFNSEGSLF